MKGLVTPKIEGKFSLRASSTGGIAMNDVFVPNETLLEGTHDIHALILGRAQTGLSAF